MCTIFDIPLSQRQWRVARPRRNRLRQWLMRWSGFLAGGLLTAQTLADSLTAARALTSGPLGVNVFVPQPAPSNTAELNAYAASLATEAEHYGVALGRPRCSDDDWEASA